MILDDIAVKRKEQLQREMEIVPFDTVKKAAEQASPPLSFKKALQKGQLSMIAEVKKSSPSKGLICPDFHPVQIAKIYETAGADAISVLTEETYFHGSPAILREVRKAVRVPVLCKDFVISPYQIYGARAIGADAVLLIAALLEEETLREYKKIADALSLTCLMEAHNKKELEKVLNSGAEIVGINNRDLKTFQVDISTTAHLARLVPPECVLVSESGFQSRADVEIAEQAGANAVLIGEALMRSGNVPATLRELRGKS